MKEHLQNQMECWVTQVGSELEMNQARVQICSCQENLRHQCGLITYAASRWSTGRAALVRF